MATKGELIQKYLGVSSCKSWESLDLIQNDQDSNRPRIDKDMNFL